MSGKNAKPIGGDLKKIDAHVLGPKDYEGIPELTDADARSRESG